MAFLTVSLLVFRPMSLLGDGTVSPPNPVGERLYRAHQLVRMAPLAIITGVLLLAWLISRSSRRTLSLPGGGASLRSQGIAFDPARGDSSVDRAVAERDRHKRGFGVGDSPGARERGGGGQADRARL